MAVLGRAGGGGGGGILRGVRFVCAGDFYQHLVESLYQRVVDWPPCAVASHTTRGALGDSLPGRGSMVTRLGIPGAAS